MPEQLKKDLIYTAYKTGLHDQVDQYQQEFQLQYDPAEEATLGDVVFLWNNGLGPVKDEWGINFLLVQGASGIVTFSNEELGLFFPFQLPDNNGSGSISDLKFIRVVCPKYRERPLVYDRACVPTSDGATRGARSTRECQFCFFSGAKTTHDFRIKQVPLESYLQKGN